MGDRTDFICYLNDDDRKVEIYVDIIEITQSYVKFSSIDNILIIPIHRILKIKRKENKE